MLQGVNVALGVTGSIAAVKTVELAHELRRQGANVRGVMTGSAQGIIHPWSLEYATDNPVVTEITGAVEHVELCGYDGWADVLLIAPATANSVGKIAHAVDDTPVTTCATTALGSGIPVIVAPAMHEPMYDHPGVLEAIEKVESWGVHFVAPRIAEGKAKIASEEAIVLDVARYTTDSPLAGKHVVVTSGGTSEAVDPVRVIANRSSGKTGRAVARALFVLGADVTLVHDGPDVPYADVEQVESAAEMLDAVRAVAGSADALVSVAAISDYTVESSDEKIRSRQDDLSLSLVPTPKLIDTIREEFPDLTIVGFKAESNGDDAALIEKAREILARADLSFVVANDASVMGQDETRALIVREHSARVFEGSKLDLGMRVAEEVAGER
ncbi:MULTISPECIES: bifunctional phosphopantothenoylcysteine decarboxylase/phosphopantothenate--cysteine ligase CoaBC [unclassified Haladaptatus]|uniref:bifunctional phosphopantothenoylcysteine decarboxylase/phosphopantothenate--cysteine ligase CoaBC n=1 Tax=unclassified Haladaptatus TaxID=2622732 RepID=UPI0023E8DB23|nr:MULTISPECIES: bifunctional phosphopantothenoylcysteine decarboxylase/phosphopantothenate--cysteine ligase CoaBC [unclassified Haladaptatus]